MEKALFEVNGLVFFEDQQSMDEEQNEWDGFEFSTLIEQVSDDDSLSTHSTDSILNLKELDILVLEHLEHDKRESDNENTRTIIDMKNLILNGKPLDALHLKTIGWKEEKEKNAKLHLQHFLELAYAQNADDQHRLYCINYCKNTIIPIVTPFESLLEQVRVVLPQLVLSNLRCDDIKNKRKTLADELRLPTTKSPFSILIRYLITVHNMYHIIKGIESPHAHSLDKILLPDRAARQKLPLIKSDPNRQHVQILVQLLGLLESEAVEILSCTPDLKQAMEIELCRYDLNQQSLIELCESYCTYRKLTSDHVADPILKDLAEHCKYEEIIKRVIELDPKLWNRTPRLLFELRCEQLAHLVSLGEYDAATTLAMTQMAPMTLVHADFVPLFRDAAVLLGLPSTPHESKLPSIVNRIELAMREKAKQREPDLILMFTYLIEIHGEWFKQMGSVDPFQSIIEKLKIVQTPSSPLPQLESMITEEFEDSDDDSDEEPDRENFITMIMEAMRIRREDAVELLRRNHGDIDTVFSSIFGA